MGLGIKLARASSWSAFAQVITRLIDMALLALLARQLTPADFGLVAKAMAFIVVVEAITIMPISQSILRVKDPERGMYDTAITLSVFRAILMVVVIGAAAWPLADYYHEPSLAPLLLALSVSAIMRSCMNPMAVELTRKFEARPGSIIAIVAKVVSFIVAATVAMTTQSYWAIVLATITTAVVQSLLSYVIMPYLPRFSLKHTKDFLDLIGWNFVTQVMAALNMQLDRFILAGNVATEAFGRYTVASDVSQIPQTALAGPLSRSMMAGFTLTNDREHLQQLWLKSSSVFAIVTGPFLVAVAVMAAPAVRIILGEQWLEASDYLALLALGILPLLPSTAVGELAMVVYKSRMIAIRMALQLIISATFLFAAIYVYGAFGAVLAKVGLNISLFIISAFMVKTLIGLSVRRQWQALQGCVLALICMGGAMEACSPLWQNVHQPLVGLVLKCGATFIVGGVVYLAVLMSVWHLSGRPDRAETLLYRAVVAALQRIRRPGRASS